MALPDFLEFSECFYGPDDHAARPAVTDVPDQALYACTDDDLIEINTGAAWVTWFDPGN